MPYCDMEVGVNHVQQAIYEGADTLLQTERKTYFRRPPPRLHEIIIKHRLTVISTRSYD